MCNRPDSMSLALVLHHLPAVGAQRIQVQIDLSRRLGSANREDIAGGCRLGRTGQPDIGPPDQNCGE